jgi:hypothetical protein
MDGETTRLIVVALGAITAGFGGASIAGAYNSRNTLATIEAARVAAETQRDADREMEHDRWLRDRKVQLYTEYVELAHNIRDSLGEVKVGAVTDVKHILEAIRRLAQLAHSVRVLCPRLLNESAMEVTRSLHTITSILGDLLESKPDAKDKYRQALDTFQEHMGLMEMRITNDLGIDWAS